jgi:hypothetical protein
MIQNGSNTSRADVSESEMLKMQRQSNHLCYELINHEPGNSTKTAWIAPEYYANSSYDRYVATKLT